MRAWMGLGMFVVGCEGAGRSYGEVDLQGGPFVDFDGGAVVAELVGDAAERWAPGSDRVAVGLVTTRGRGFDCDVAEARFSDGSPAGRGTGLVVDLGWVGSGSQDLVEWRNDNQLLGGASGSQGTVPGTVQMVNESLYEGVVMLELGVVEFFAADCGEID